MPNVVAAVDRGDASYDAVLRAAARQAQGGSLTVMCVARAPLEWISDPHDPAEERTRSARAQTEAAITQELVERGLTAQRVWVPLARKANVGDDVIERARELQADLIVVGTHGRTGLGALLIGSVAERVVRHAHCDVYVVRTRES